MKKYLLIFIVFTGMFSNAQYQPSKENLEARKWFQDAKFGAFYSLGSL